MVSVIIPIYNASNYLEKCIISVTNQTYTNLEIILINDGSTDVSGQICNKFAQKDTRIRVIHKKNEGIATTRQLGIDTSTGDYIIFIDSDDYIEKDMIMQMYNAFDNHIDMVVCGYYTEIGNHTITNKIDKCYQSESLLRMILEGKTIGALWNKMIRSSIYKDFKFNTDIYYSEDVLILSDILLCRVKNIKYLSKPLYHYVIHSNSLTRTVTRDSFDNKLMFLDNLENILIRFNYQQIGIINIINLNYIISMIKSQLYSYTEISTYYKKRKKIKLRKHYYIKIFFLKIKYHLLHIIFSNLFTFYFLKKIKYFYHNFKTHK